MRKMQIETINISDITPYEKNAKSHPKKQIDLLAENITRFGFTTPCLVDKDNNLIAGHGRLEAVKTLGWTDVPCVRMENLTEDEVKALRLADNKLAEMSEWDMTLVTDELKELDDDLLDLTGFDKDLIVEPDEADDEVPDVPEEPQSKLGDLYELGEHRVLCGDSTKVEDVERLMDGKKADMVFTDPPYALFGNSTGVAGVADDKMVQPFFREISVRVLQNTKSNSHFYVCCDWHSWSVLTQALSHNLTVKNMVVWDKCHGALGNLYRSRHELLVVGVNASLNTRKIIGGTANKRPVTDENVWTIKREKDGSHNAQKPQELMIRAINNSSDKKDLVLDLFLGSGSTLIAAEKTGRICYGMELDPRYISVILDRWSDYTGNDPILKETTDPNDPRKGLAWSVIKSSSPSESS